MTITKISKLPKIVFSYQEGPDDEYECPKCGKGILEPDEGEGWGLNGDNEYSNCWYFEADVEKYQVYNETDDLYDDYAEDEEDIENDEEPWFLITESSSQKLSIQDINGESKLVITESMDDGKYRGVFKTDSIKFTDNIEDDLEYRDEDEDED